MIYVAREPHKPACMPAADRVLPTLALLPVCALWGSVRVTGQSPSSMQQQQAKKRGSSRQALVLAAVAFAAQQLGVAVSV